LGSKEAMEVFPICIVYKDLFLVDLVEGEGELVHLVVGRQVDAS
jgi:hypothetical protein